ncbi:MAG TPA: hypothetical protein VMI06_11035 [Terriglobia bacterium]|nr:hypothetical protein [Terriglobia bacterium]
MRKLIASAARHHANEETVRHSLEQHSVSTLVMVVLIVMVCLLPTWTSAQAVKTEKGKVPPRLKGAVGCLVKADFVRQYDLNYLGLKVGDWAWVRYQVGSISGVGDTPGVFNIVVYSQDGKRGMLLFADPDQNGGFNAVLNAYRLRRHGSEWNADYGNGGYVMYEAIGKFITELSRSSRYRIQLVPGGNECKAEGAKGE